MPVVGEDATTVGSLRRQFQEAVALQQRGDLNAAVQKLHAILEQAPGNSDCLQLLGAIEVLRGNFTAAEDLLGRAIQSDPKAAAAHNNLGMALMAQKRAEEAIRHYEAAIVLNPQYAAAFNNLGSALSALDRPEAAAQRFREALVIRPDFALARTNLGSALASLGRHEEAIAEHQRALATQADNAVVHMNLASTLQAAGRNEQALPHFAQAREFQPHLSAVHTRLGTTLQELGRIEEARACFEKAIELEPQRPAHYLNLTGNMRMQQGDRRIAAMEALARAEDSIPEIERPTIHFALGKALTDIGQHERAFRHLLRGNALKRKQVEYDEVAVIGRLRRVREVFTAELMHRGRDKGAPSRQPIFILGMPRSGSTLVEQILASHPDVFAAGEVMAFRDAIKSIGAEDGPVPFPDSVPGLSAADLRRLAANYLEQMRGTAAINWRGDGGKTPQRITDKLPANFRHAGLIHLALPNARIIHTCRDPIDTCLSCFATEFARQPFTFDLGELGRHWRAYAELMAHWRALLPPGVMLDVQYESVVSDFEREARRIVAHCGLAWTDACLEFQQAQRPVRTASVVQVRQPLYRSSVGRWRPDDQTLAPLLQGLGIAPTTAQQG